MSHFTKKFAQFFSKAIHGNQTTILLGSGASVNHLSGTTAVTDKLKTWTKHNMPRQSNMVFSYPQIATEVDGLTGQTPYFQELYNFLMPSFKNPEPFLHFERLIHVAQSLDYHTTSASEETNDYVKVGSGPLTPISEKHIGLDNRIHNVVASDACTYILDIFAIEERNITKSGILEKDPLNELFKKLSSKSYLRLFTLNYDTLPLHSGINFVSGFKKSSPTSLEESFYPIDIRSSYRAHLFCQLHGSSRFGYNSGNGDSRGLIVRLPDHDTALENRATTAVGNHLAQDGIEGISQLMITGLRKADAILHEPFATYFTQLFEDLINSNTLLIVGYSGGDKHVNEIIKRAHSHRAEIGLHTKILWIGFLSPDKFDSAGEARMQINDIPWQSLGITRTILPDNYIESMKHLSEKKRILSRNKINIFQHDGITIGYCFQGSPDAFSQCGDEILSFLDV